MSGQTLYSSKTVIGLSGASGITSLCKHMPQCSMCLFSKDLSRCFFVAQNEGIEASAKQIVANKESICNLSIFVVSARKNEFDASMKIVEKYLQIGDSFGAQKVIVAINKMDAVKYSQDRFCAIKDEMNEMMKQQKGVSMDQLLAFIPLSAVNGDNVLDKSANMEWYVGPTLKEVTAECCADKQLLGLSVCRSIEGEKEEFCLDNIEGETLTIGDAVKFFPSGIASTVDSIRSYEQIIDFEHGGKVIGIKINRTKISLRLVTHLYTFDTPSNHHITHVQLILIGMVASSLLMFAASR